MIMIRELSINTALLEALTDECNKSRLPVYIRRVTTYTDEDGTEMADIIIEHPYTDFDFNAVLGRVINEYMKEL